ncbi:hypothetical protein BV25DRAFT_1922416 [Artomyces pyxidatus]|uniref:Uncharacterized protein n=1 Tax=Artomyces pyxidatus TaxID=48021 RepID=A0ACB8SEH1_9AGAM|nr:hypothetical protein BV25DRAFT_1922416 [Artomyces pyxidatus]
MAITRGRRSAATSNNNSDQALTPQQRAAQTRKANQARKAAAKATADGPDAAHAPELSVKDASEDGRQANTSKKSGSKASKNGRAVGGAAKERKRAHSQVDAPQEAVKKRKSDGVPPAPASNPTAQAQAYEIPEDDDFDQVLELSAAPARRTQRKPRAAAQAAANNLPAKPASKPAKAARKPSTRRIALSDDEDEDNSENTATDADAASKQSDDELSEDAIEEDEVSGEDEGVPAGGVQAAPQSGPFKKTTKHTSEQFELATPTWVRPPSPPRPVPSSNARAPERREMDASPIEADDDEYEARGSQSQTPFTDVDLSADHDVSNSDAGVGPGRAGLPRVFERPLSTTHGATRKPKPGRKIPVVKPGPLLSEGSSDADVRDISISALHALQRSSNSNTRTPFNVTDRSIPFLVAFFHPSVTFTTSF